MLSGYRYVYICVLLLWSKQYALMEEWCMQPGRRVGRLCVGDDENEQKTGTVFQNDVIVVLTRF